MCRQQLDLKQKQNTQIVRNQIGNEIKSSSVSQITANKASTKRFASQIVNHR